MKQESVFYVQKLVNTCGKMHINKTQNKFILGFMTVKHYGG